LALTGEKIESSAVGASKGVIEGFIIANSIERIVKLISCAGSTSSNGNIKVRLTSFAILALKSASVPDRSTGRTS